MNKTVYISTDSYIRSLENKIEHLEKELYYTEKVLQERERVLKAIPECPVHGECVPHALEWIEERL